MKKAILLLLPLVLLFTLCMGGAYADGAALTLDSCEAEPGAEVSVPLRISGNPGIISVEFDVVYDKEVLEWTGVQAGDYSGTIGDYEIGIGQSVAWFARDERTDIVQDGVLVTLSFKIKEDTEAQTTQIGINYDEDNIFNADFENVYFSVAPSVVTIKDPPVPKYVVNYDANGGINPPDNQEKIHDTTLTLPTVIPTHPDESAGSYTVTLNANGGNVSTGSLTAARTTIYSFKTWNTEANGSGTNYAPGASYTANAAVTLYAQWNSNTTTAAVTLPTPTREGYSFKGWGTSENATEVITGNYTPTENINLFAIWEANKYTIKFVNEDGTVLQTGEVAYGTKPVYSGATPTKAATAQYTYTFKDWTPSIVDVTGAATYTATYTAIPVFGTPNFTLPAAIKTIEESAFEGVSFMTVVEIPDSCESIGKWAFKGCTGLTQIRIPASVTFIHDTAFDGCANVFVYSISPSVAETFCASHANCTFVAEDTSA